MWSPISTEATFEGRGQRSDRTFWGFRGVKMANLVECCDLESKNFAGSHLCGAEQWLDSFLI